MSISTAKRLEALRKIEPSPALDAETIASLDAMSEDETHMNAVNDSDAPPSSDEQLHRAAASRHARQVSQSAYPKQSAQAPSSIASFFSKLFGA